MSSKPCDWHQCAQCREPIKLVPPCPIGVSVTTLYPEDGEPTPAPYVGVTTGSISDLVHLAPAQARELARQLLDEADRAESVR